MLKATPKFWTFWRYRLFDGDQQIGEVNSSYWFLPGIIQIGDLSYSIYRTGFPPFFPRDFVMEEDKKVVARATGNSLTGYKIECGGMQLQLSLEKFLRLKYSVLKNGQVVGAVTPQRRTALLDLPEDLAIQFKAFIAWVATTGWRSWEGGGAS